MRRLHRAVLIPLISLLTLALAGCQGQPVTLLDDPEEILAAAATTAAAGTSVHVDIAVDGRISLDPLGTGAGAPIDLRDTSASADLDLATGRLKATFSSPGLLGIAGEAILVDETLFLKTTLTGTKFRPSALSAPTENPLKGLTELLARTDLDPVKGDDVPCAGGTCYTLTIKLDAADLAGLGGPSGLPVPSDLPIPIPDLSAAAVDLTLHVEQRTTRLSGITAVVGMADLGNLGVQATFTRWNEPVQIVAPPGDQVEGSG
jgi:hypothetical protein